MRKLFWIAVIVFIAATVFYLSGPKPEKPDYNTDLPVLDLSTHEVEAFVENKNASLNIKPGNESQIVWYDPINKTKTKVAVLYLHGFSASPREGFPTHIKFAEKFGCNLYLPLLSDHGIVTDEPMLELTANRLWESAKEAYALAKNLGDEVVVMSTSTGGTLALKLAATYPEIKGLINFSPNIEINDNWAFLLNKPWGLQIAQYTFKSDYRTVDATEEYKKYWYATYRLEAIVELQELVATAATREVFEKVKCPVFNGAYYRNEKNQDPVVRVSAIRKMHKQLGTPANKKKYVEFPNANTHIIACDLQSSAIPEVLTEIFSFAKEVLEMENEI